MIQRIQSLYLLLTSILMALMLVLPLGRFLSGDEEFIFRAFGIEHGDTGDVVLANTFLGVMIVIAAVLPFVNIFLFKNRVLQLRLCLVGMFLLLGVEVYVVLYLMRGIGVLHSLNVNATAFSVTDVMPIVGVVLTWLAARAIRRDETLVRSLDRIR